MTEFMRGFLIYVGYFFIAYLVMYSSFLFCSVLAGSLELYRQKRRNRLKNELDEDYYVPVSILVPAHNEEVTVADTVRSLLELDYLLYEIVIVDDGSTDKTAEQLVHAFDMKKIARPIRRQVFCQQEKAVYEVQIGKVLVTLIVKKNGGKADALNMGINAARYPYFICMDADSVLQADSLKEIVKPVLEDHHVVACGGLVRISNSAKLRKGRLITYHMPWNPIVGMQIMEYDRSFLASRLMMNQFNGNLIISGAFGLFQKKIVISAGGYDASTMGEDMELVMRLHVFCQKNKLPYSIQYAPGAICWSQAPSTVGDLMKQRRRWHLGLFQSMFRHRQMFLNREFGMVGYVSYFYYLLYELLSPFIELFGVFTMVAAVALNLVHVRFMVLFYLVYALFGAVMTLTAFFARIYTHNITLRASDAGKAVLMCIAEALFFRFILAYVRITAFLGYKKRGKQWGSLKREKINIG